MANRRMFSKTITNSSKFLMMSHSAQNLYFHLGMNADDDGFCEHFSIMRMTDSKPDDLKILQAKNFIRIFDEEVLVILDWNENNYIRSDRYTKSKYLKKYKEEIKQIEAKIGNGIPVVYQTVDKLDTQVRLGKVRKGKSNIKKNIKKKKEDNRVNDIWDYYIEVAGTKEKLLPKRKKLIRERLNTFSVEEIKTAIKKCFRDAFYTGKNDRGWIANSDYIFRDDEKIDKLFNLKEDKFDYNPMRS